MSVTAAPGIYVSMYTYNASHTHAPTFVQMIFIETDPLIHSTYEYTCTIAFNSIEEPSTLLVSNYCNANSDSTIFGGVIKIDQRVIIIFINQPVPGTIKCSHIKMYSTLNKKYGFIKIRYLKK